MTANCVTAQIERDYLLSAISAALIGYHEEKTEIECEMDDDADAQAAVMRHGFLWLKKGVSRDQGMADMLMRRWYWPAYMKRRRVEEKIERLGAIRQAVGEGSLHDIRVPERDLRLLSAYL